LDADPEAARARKPEYPLEFLHSSRRCYFQLAEMLRHMTVIPPLSLTNAKKVAEQALDEVLQRESIDARTQVDTAQTV
jgi:hypothetical protein